MPYLARSIWRIRLDSLECALRSNQSTEGIRRTGNWSNAFSCEVFARIRRISFVGYGVLVKFQQSSNIFVLAPNYAPFSLSSQNTPELLHLSTLKQYEHVGLKVTRSQEGKRLQDDEKRRCMVDDLKKLKITGKSN
ncbi:hypothetical protein Tco_1007765 [Tanacetum coccineum]